MPSTTPRTSRPGAIARRPRSTGGPATSRFGRPAAKPVRGSRGPATIVVRGRRKQQKPSGIKGVLSALPSLPGKSGSSKSRGRAGGGKGKGKGKGAAGGLAVLAGVAGVAFKNRDKLTSKLGHSHDEQQDHGGSVDTMPPAAAVPTTPGTPPPVTP